MVPVINYGEIIADEHCLLYAATLLGLMESEYYDRLCALADLCGAETRLPGGTGLQPVCHVAADRIG
jgi:hypothetical protein